MSELQPIDIVRARWLEAADTDMRLPIGGGGNKSGCWPEYEHTFEDKAGWGTARLKEEREMRIRRIPPSAPAIRRHNEVLEHWTAHFITDPDSRRIVWTWAFSIVAGKSFALWIRRSGMARATVYRHLKRALEQVSRSADIESLTRDLPGEIHLRQIMGDQPIDLPTLDELPTSPTSWLAPGEQPSDLPENRDFSWADKQASRHSRKVAEREAKRRKLLGVEG
ncbi:MAG TPA: DUF6362 family protein [Xanthobacteraceae bacterium]|nr:DUF6362 family protein [Xanthobacteraceae bacterium]